MVQGPEKRAYCRFSASESLIGIDTLPKRAIHESNLFKAI